MARNPDFAGGLVGSDVEAIAFDPWKLSAERDAEGLAWYRAAELKHGRICMLAALGLFVQGAFHLPDDVFSNDKGLGALAQVSAERPQAIAQILIAIGAIEVAGLAASEGKGPGDYGFDPLNLKPKTEEAFEELQVKGELVSGGETQAGRPSVLPFGPWSVGWFVCGGWGRWWVGAWAVAKRLVNCCVG